MTRTAHQYSEALARRILREVRRGHTDQSLPYLEGMPCKESLYDWRRRYPDFGRRWRDACAAREGRMLRRRGRPRDQFIYTRSCTQAFADLLCERLIGGRSMPEALDAPGMPSEATVHLWLNRHEWFRQQYAFALDIRMVNLVKEAVDIADGLHNPPRDPLTDRAALIAELRRDKMRFAARRWRVAVLQPRKHFVEW